MHSERLIHSFKSEREHQGSGQIQWVGFFFFFLRPTPESTRERKKSKQDQIAGAQVEDGS